MTSASLSESLLDRSGPPELHGARELLHAGVPLFLARPALRPDGVWDPHGGTGGTGYQLPKGWQQTAVDPGVLDRWHPGWAVCAVTGHVLDVLDVDPRNDGEASSDRLREEVGVMPTVYARTATPSGGWHFFIARLGLPKSKPWPGIDYQAGAPDGSGRGFVFLPPTVRESKATEQPAPYMWLSDPDGQYIRECAPDDDSGEPLADLVRAAAPSNGKATGDGLVTVKASPWDDIDATLRGGRQQGVVALAGSLRGYGRWTLDQALFVFRTMVFPRIDQQQGGEPFPWSECEAQVRDVFTRYPDGGEERAGGAETSQQGRLTPGGAFVLDVPATTPAVWGEGTRVLWAKGESLMIASPPGLGKTTLAGQVVRGLVLGGRTVLGLPVERAPMRVLYLAMDRPAQIRRALHRQFLPDHRDALDERLVVWPGPPPADLAATPGLLTALAQRAEASHVVVDSLKDAALRLTEDETGSAWNRARQTAHAAGVDVLELHHLIKRGPNGTAPTTLADVYGSTWLTSGAGSVVLLVGTPGEPVVGLRHVKTPADTVGPLQLLHDHDAGTTTVLNTQEPTTLIAQAGPNGITATRLAQAMGGGTAKPADIERARRALEKEVTRGTAVVTEADRATGGRAERVYRPARTEGAEEG